MISTLKQAFLLISTLFLSHICFAQTVFWSFPPSAGQGVITTTSGKVAWFKPNVVPSSPNPAGTVWVPCKDNFIVLNKTATGENIPSVVVNQVLANLLFAQANGSNIRVGINRNSSNDCFGTQIFQNK